MATYALRITADPAKLSPIERGGNVRIFAFPTLQAAKAARNIGLFTSGYSMIQGPRRLAVGQEDEYTAGSTIYTITRME